MEFIKKQLEGTEATLEMYLHGETEELNHGKRSALILAPGGGYFFTSDREAEPVALRLFSAGMNVFTLRYSVGEKASNFRPLIEILTLIKYVRDNAEEFNIDPERVFTMGFSAGGHLAGSAGILCDIPELNGILEDNRDIYRPNGMILCYPVITAGEKAHLGSIQNVSGHQELTDEDIELFSLEKNISDKTPPAFIWHASDDGLVPVENSLMLATALRAHKIPFELHIYPKGGHGLSLCNKETWSGYPHLIAPYSEGWMELCINWIDKYPNFN